VVLNQEVVVVVRPEGRFQDTYFDLECVLGSVLVALIELVAAAWIVSMELLAVASMELLVVVSMELLAVASMELLVVVTMELLVVVSPSLESVLLVV
jgi:hypothetical protein